MPASGWLAIGSVVAALAAPGAGVAVVALVAAGLAAAAWGLAHPTSRRSLLGVALGAAALVIRLLLAPAPPPVAAAIPEGSGPWVAAVTSVGSPRDGSQVATLELEAMDSVSVAATLPRYPAIEPGMRIRVSGTIRPPPEGSYGDYLRRTGVAGTLRTRSLDVVPGGGDPGNALERLRRHASTALAAAIPEPEAGLASGIVIGLRDRVDRDLAADFTAVGASHVVAISGWNIAIVAACVAALCGRLSRQRRALVTVVAIVAYVAFAGASASVVRAAAMAGVVLVARESGRAGRAAAALGWAALLLLLVDPHLVSDAGFQLSSLATAGILAWATPFNAWLAGRMQRLPDWLVECLAVSLVAQAATLPVVLLSFGRLALVSPVVNLGVVPLVAPAMAACAVALLGGLATLAGGPAALATIFGLPAWFLLSVMVGIVQTAARLPFASATIDPPWNGVAAGAAAGAVLLVVAGRRFGGFSRWRRAPGPARSPDIAPRSSPAADVAMPSRPQPRPETRPTRRRATRYVAVAVVAACTALVLVAAHRPDGVTRITVLDVGQGDAILVEGSRGGRMLVDGGPDPDRLLVQLDRRLPPWDRRIDVLVLTHPHEDHVAGFPLLIERYRVGHVYENGMRGPGPGYAAWEAALSRPGAPLHGRLSTGDTITIDDARFTVLWPDQGCVPRAPPDSGREINDRSIVLLGTVGGRRVLLTGDLEDDVDPVLLARSLPRIDFLKVAHHGSGTASSETLLGALRPRLAAISAGTGNTYGHPAPATVGRLHGVGAIVERTDLDGAVTVSIGAGWMAYDAAGATRPVNPVVAAAPEPEMPATIGSAAVVATGASVAAGCAIPSGG
jgi:competence protein ComEC